MFTAVIAVMTFGALFLVPAGTIPGDWENAWSRDKDE
jgi:hypothetical protein